MWGAQPWALLPQPGLLLLHPLPLPSRTPGGASQLLGTACGAQELGWGFSGRAGPGSHPHHLTPKLQFSREENWFRSIWSPDRLGWVSNLRVGGKADISCNSQQRGGENRLSWERRWSRERGLGFPGLCFIPFLGGQEGITTPDMAQGPPAWVTSHVTALQWHFSWGQGRERS